MKKILPEQPVKESSQDSGERPKNASSGASHSWKAGHEAPAAIMLQLPLTDHKPELVMEVMKRKILICSDILSDAQTEKYHHNFSYSMTYFIFRL